MHESSVLIDVTVIAVLALIMELVAIRFKISPVIGLLVAGVVAGIFGPQGMHLLGHGTETLLMLAEVGVGFLVLPIGVEFDLKKLVSMWKQVLIGGLLQLVLTSLVSSVVYAFFFEGSLSTAILVGFLTTMSSTVVVVERLEERRKLHTSGGKLAVGILIFQDLSLLPLAFILPAMKPGAGTTWIAPLIIGIAVLAFAFWIELRLVNPFLKMIIAKNDKALLTLALVAICLSLVVVCMFVNLSPVFGMFLAGLLLSRTESRCEILGIALQAKKVFGPLHFVSFGLLIDYHLVGEHSLKIAVSVVGLILIKLFSGWLTSVMMGYTLKSACKVSGALAHIGELSFVLAALGAKLGIISEVDFKVFVIIAVATIFLSPFVMSFFIKFGDCYVDKSLLTWFFSLKPIRRCAISLQVIFTDPELCNEDFINLVNFLIARYTAVRREEIAEQRQIPPVVILGFGIVGQYIANSLILRGLPVVVVESTNETYQLALNTPGIFKVVFGDCANKAVLEEACVANARAVVMTFSGEIVREVTLNNIREISPKVPVVIRVHRHEHLNGLVGDAVTEVVLGSAAAAAATENALCAMLGLANINPMQVGEIGKLVHSRSGHLLPIQSVTGGSLSN